MAIKFNKFSLFALVALLLFQPEAFATTYPINGDIIGEITNYTVKDGDNFYSIARTFDLGIVEMLAANKNIDPWIPEIGSILSLPTSHILPKNRTKGIVINLSELRLFYFVDNKTVMTFPIGIGREGWQTPLGTTKVTLKRRNPTWTPPASIRAVKPDLPASIPPGEDNPMGAYAMNLGLPGIAIHGTNKPHGIGLRSSHGCIRMYTDDIEALFKAVPTNTPVTIIDTSYKIGWAGNIMFLEVVPTQEQVDDISEYRQPERLDRPEIYDEIIKNAGTKEGIDWFAVENTLIDHSGLPVAVFSK